MTDAGAEASREAIAAERLRSIRFVGLFRFVGISTAGALNLLVPLVVPAMRAYQSDLRLSAAYWLIATAVFWATRRSSRLATLVGVDICLVDMPFVYLLQASVIARNPGIPAAALATTMFDSPPPDRRDGPGGPR
jgi:hypothetical protein